jgi:hypothetical protein
LCYFINFQIAMSTSSGAGKAQEASIEAVRDLHQVRPLAGSEEGNAISALPPGVYGYTFAPSQDEVPVFSKKSYHSFEVHKASDGTEYLIGFVSPAEGRDIHSGRQGASIRMFPEPRENAPSLVSVPFSQMGASRKSPREDGNPFLFNLA